VGRHRLVLTSLPNFHLTPPEDRTSANGDTGQEPPSSGGWLQDTTLAICSMALVASLGSMPQRHVSCSTTFCSEMVMRGMAKGARGGLIWIFLLLPYGNGGERANHASWKPFRPLDMDSRWEAWCEKQSVHSRFLCFYHTWQVRGGEQERSLPGEIDWGFRQGCRRSLCW
jgi:hypothetical protein